LSDSVEFRYCFDDPTHIHVFDNIIVDFSLFACRSGLPSAGCSPMSGAKSDLDMSLSAALPAPTQPESVRGRQSSIGRAFKRLRIAIRRIGSSGGKESGGESTTLQRPSISSVPIETLVVDEGSEEADGAAAAFCERYMSRAVLLFHVY